MRQEGKMDESYELGEESSKNLSVSYLVSGNPCNAIAGLMLAR